MVVLWVSSTTRRASVAQSTEKVNQNLQNGLSVARILAAEMRRDEGESARRSRNSVSVDANVSVILMSLKKLLPSMRVEMGLTITALSTVHSVHDI